MKKKSSLAVSSALPWATSKDSRTEQKPDAPYVSFPLPGRGPPARLPTHLVFRDAKRLAMKLVKELRFLEHKSFNEPRWLNGERLMTVDRILRELPALNEEVKTRLRSGFMSTPGLKRTPS